MNRLLALVALTVACPVSAAPGALFASSEPLRLRLEAPIDQLADGRRESGRSVTGTLRVAATGEALPVTLGLRGITRLSDETCQFPPLKVSFAAKPPAASAFAGEDELKLVTHCQDAASFQQYVLLEYAAYRLYNLLTPASFRVRLAAIDYVGGNGRPLTSRVGFFIEDNGAAAKRLGMRKASVGSNVPLAIIDPAAAARMSLFEYMISNLDWAVNAGPAGEACCHNGRLLSPAGGGALVPLPYDFDYSGLVDAPYAVPPNGFSANNVRQRFYRGYCIHNDAAIAAAAQFRAARPAMMAELAATPGLEPRTVKKATAYLDGFFADIATDAQLQSKVLRRCLK